MNEIITWAAQHNTLVIQVAFSVVLLLILIYVYRLFFVSSSSSSASSAESSAEFGELNQKLTQLLEQQKSGGVSAPAGATATPAAAATAEAPAAAGEVGNGIEQLKAENAKLKTQLNESEKKVFEMTPVEGAEKAAKEEAAAVDLGQVAELNKKIEELQSRLSEYDIIADDIAELSQLRSENADLKKKITDGGESISEAAAVETVATPAAEPATAEAESSLQAAVAPEASIAVEASVNTEPVAETVSAPVIEALPDIEIPEPVEEVTPETSEAPTTEMGGGVPGFEAETSALLDSLVNQTDAAIAAAQTEAEPAVAAVEPPATVAAEAPSAPAAEELQTKTAALDQNVPDGEKNLINEFEKSIQKGS